MHIHYVKCHLVILLYFYYEEEWGESTNRNNGRNGVSGKSDFSLIYIFRKLTFMISESIYHVKVQGLLLFSGGSAVIQHYALSNYVADDYTKS